MIDFANLLDRTCGELPRAPLLRWAAVLFTLFVLTVQISIAASEALLTGAGVLYAIHLLRHRTPVFFPPVKLPLALFCVLSINSIFWATNPAAGWFVVRKLVLFLIWLLAVNLVTSAELLRRQGCGGFMVSALASLVGIGQFVIQYRQERGLHPGEVYKYMTSTRISGFMGHWMHFGGQEMMVWVFLLAYLLLAKNRNSKLETRNWKFKTRNLTGERVSIFDFRASPWWWGVLALVSMALILNFTRGVWLGCLVAGVYLVAQWRPKWLLVLPLLAVLAYWGSPRLLRQRFHMAMHPRHEPALSIRLEMWGVALKMIRAHPWVGVGPNNIDEVYDLYLPPRTTPEKGYHNHLHSDYLQLAAERGLPCLAAWLWLMASLGWHIGKLRRRLSAASWIADAAFAAWLAFLLEGCFEFNFGTSPVLMMFLLVTAAPFVAARIAGGPEELGKTRQTERPL